MNPIIRSSAESEKFNLDVGRLNLLQGKCSYEDMHSQLEAFELLIIDSPESNPSICTSLKNDNWDVYCAGATMRWESDLRNGSTPVTRFEGLPSVIELENDPSNLTRAYFLIEQIFEGYRTHLHSSSRFHDFDITSGYKDWVGRMSVNSNFNFFVIQQPSGEDAGFASTLSREGVLEVTLAGVLPEFRNQGIYSLLLRELMRWAREHEFEKLEIDTQIENIAVQRQWAKSGLVPASSFFRHHAWRPGLKFELDIASSS